MSFAFGYDSLGRLVGSTPTTNTTALSTDAYSYTTTNQVSTGPITGSSGSDAYTYQTAGAISADTNSFAYAGYSPSGELCWTDPTTGGPSCGSTPSGETTYSSNADGERTAVTPPSGGDPESLGWETSSERLICVNTNGTTCSTTSPTSTTTLYSYNGDGLRATAVNQGSTNAFVWNPSGPQLLADSTHDYVYGLDSTTPILQIETGGFVTTPTVDLLVDDTNHDTRGVVQLQGDATASDDTLVNYTDYDAYGNPITESGGSSNPRGLATSSLPTNDECAIGFATAYEDQSGLDYLIHRYYDPVTGRFVESVDPEVESTMQPYIYPAASIQSEMTTQAVAGGACHLEQQGRAGRASQ